MVLKDVGTPLFDARKAMRYVVLHRCVALGVFTLLTPRPSLTAGIWLSLLGGIIFVLPLRLRRPFPQRMDGWINTMLKCSQSILLQSERQTPPATLMMQSTRRMWKPPSKASNTRTASQSPTSPQLCRFRAFPPRFARAVERRRLIETTWRCTFGRGMPSSSSGCPCTCPVRSRRSTTGPSLRKVIGPLSLLWLWTGAWSCRCFSRTTSLSASCSCALGPAGS